MGITARSAAERNEALEAANRARADRSAAMSWVYESVRGGDAVTLRDVIERYGFEPWFARTKVERLVRAVPGFGTKRAPKVMEGLGIHRSRRLGGITDGQEERLMAWFDEASREAAGKAREHDAR